MVILERSKNKRAETGYPEVDEELPDDWIDRCIEGLEEPVIEHQGKAVTPVELSTYNGSALTWLRWIGEFRCLIHNTGLGPEQKGPYQIT